MTAGETCAKPSVLIGPLGATLVSIVLGASMLSTGCVRRTIVITTDPPHARVFLNDQEIGRSKISTDFLWYGDYDVVIRKEGYETLQTHWKVQPPWYQIVPIDFFAEVLWPGRLHDQHTRHFELQASVLPTSEELIGRATELRTRALDTRK